MIGADVLPVLDGLRDRLREMLTEDTPTLDDLEELKAAMGDALAVVGDEQ